MAIPRTSAPWFHKRNGITILPADAGEKMKLLNNIKIYRDKEFVKEITN